MKKMKTLASLVLALVLAMALTVPAFAASNGSITITGANDDATYTYYKVFDVDSYSGTGTDKAVAYTMVKNSQFETLVRNYKYNNETVFTLTASANNANVYVVTASKAFIEDDEVAGANFAAYLRDAVRAPGANFSGTAMTVENGNATATGLDLGYYFVDTTVGTLCVLQSAAPSVSVADKSKAPTVDKTEDAQATAGSKKIGDTVNFTIIVDAKNGAQGYVVYDKLGAGLDLTDNSVKVCKNAETTELAGATVTYATETDPITYDKGTTKNLSADFKVVFTDAVLNALVDTDTIKITYSATINDSAVTESIGNDVNLKFGDNMWASDTTHGGTNNPDNLGDIVIDKYDSTNVNTKLAGATFQLLDGSSNQIKLKAVMKTVDAPTTEDPDATAQVVDYYIPDVNGTADVVTDANGAATIKGLGMGDYYLKETVAPEGYNLATANTKVSLTYDGQTFKVSNGEADIENSSGAQLPETGGMGTTLFYTIGGLLVVCSAILIVTKKRMSSIA